MTTQTSIAPPKRRTTRRSVRSAEAVARALISIGGIATILAVTMICVFLVWVVAPIFSGASRGAGSVARPALGGRPRAFAVDEFRTLGWALLEDGTLASFRLDDGAVLEQRRLFDGDLPSAFAFDRHEETATFGFADGSLRTARLAFGTRFLEPEQVPADLRDLAEGEAAPFEGGLLQRIQGGQLRLQSFAATLGDPIQTPFRAPLVLVDRVSTPSGEVVCGLDESGLLALLRLRATKNLLTGETTFKLRTAEIPYEPSPRLGAPKHLLLSGTGDNVYLVWEDGHLLRFSVLHLDAPRLAERADLVPEPGAVLAALDTLLGRRTLLSGDSLGRVRAWFLVKREDAGTPDGSLLAMGHDLAAGPGPVTALAPSGRGRVLAASYGDGSAALFYATSGERLLNLALPGGAARSLAIAPKQDGLYAWTDAGLWGAAIDVGHPEGSPAALFTPVWYEGYPGPEHFWQSTGSTDDFEPKLGLVPLVFGTIKATLYSMLFGVPLALLAAIYTAEFLSPRLRVPVKSVIEMMASLPSVVLGFIAALVMAPFVQRVLPAVLTAFVAVPAAFVAGAYLWQLLPGRWQVRYGGWQRFLLTAAFLPLGVLAAAWAGPLLERLLFAGDLELWLDGQRGSPRGGWVFLMLPLSVLFVAVGVRPFDAWLRRAAARWDAARYAQADFLKFLAAAAVAVGLSWALASALTALGFDPRGSVFGTYVQRNALIVGFVMGFAIIPIIYTLAEDALSSVPEHLRLASLSAGATPWQTAMRVIVPTAMSGLFSAVMIGLGRAVGETMIVLMATGNTPVMEWNVFDGFRTLSANIAVELPEAVENSTHYRTLFLAALILFALTFVLNTFAELVRQRFRRRAYQL